MLQRASGLEADDSECDDPMVTLVCNADPENALCPEACRPSEKDEPEEPTVVKAGDLAVSATASSTKKAIINGVSDLDTLTFKTSEEVEISRVTLERYGYSKYSDIDEVRLEDEDGNVIADAKSVSSKDQVTLSIDKDYRKVDGTLNATIVVKLNDVAKVGSTIGFKVKSADSSAENLNIKNYEPNTYDVVDYSGSVVELTARGANKTYNYVEGDSYEVAKFKVKAGDAPIKVSGFTLTNTGDLDLEDFLDEVEVTADEEAIKGTKYSVSDNELTVSFPAIEVEARSNVTFAVSATLADFDDYGTSIHFNIKQTSDFSAVETKTDARVSVNALTNMGVYKFNGGETKFSNVKLGNIDASQGSTDVLVAEGTVTVSEPLDKVTIVLTAKADENNSGAKAIDEMRISINGEEFDGKIAADGSKVTFENVEIEKSGKVKFYIDIKDDEHYLDSKFSFSSLNATAITAARYANSKEDARDEIAGSISFGTITVQKAKASFENSLENKAVSFMANDTTTNLVFDGTLTAKKANINIQEFSITGDDSYGKDDFLFHLLINGKEIKSVELGDTATISYEVKAGEEVNVQVKAEIDAAEADATRYYSDFQLVLNGEDDNGVEIATLKEPLIDMKVVAKAQVEVDAASTNSNILKKGRNKTVAQFILRSENKEEGSLEDMTLFVVADGKVLGGDDLTVKVAGSSESDYEADADVINATLQSLVNNSKSFTASEKTALRTKTLTAVKYSLSNDNLADGISVEVNAKEQYNKVVVFLVKANGKGLSKSFTTAYEDALVRIDSQSSDGVQTTFNFSVDKTDSSYEVSKLWIYASDGTTAGSQWYPVDAGTNEITNGETEDFSNAASARFVKALAYAVSADSEKDGECYKEDTYINKVSDYTTKSACEGAKIASENGVCVTTSNTDATEKYICPEGYYNAASPSDTTINCSKLVTANGAASNIVYVDGKPYSVDSTVTTGAKKQLSCPADTESVKYTLEDGKCITKTTTSTTEINCTGEGKEFTEVTHGGYWKAATAETIICVSADATMPEFNGDMQASTIFGGTAETKCTRTWAGYSDFLKTAGGKSAYIDNTNK